MNKKSPGFKPPPENNRRPKKPTPPPPEKRGLTIDEIISKYPASVRILIVQLVAQIEKLEKPRITEKWKEEKAREIALKNFEKYTFDWRLKTFRKIIHSLIKDIEEAP